MKKLKNEQGFSLIEMMIVLLIISILILIAIPNVTKHSQSIDEKGCEAYVTIIELKVNTLNKPRQINDIGDVEKGLINFNSIIAQKNRSHECSKWTAIQNEPFILCLVHREKHFSQLLDYVLNYTRRF